nr:protein THYLAKOID ASSEMBLY 8, chloroplastic [Ipomoea batatas]
MAASLGSSLNFISYPPSTTARPASSAASRSYIPVRCGAGSRSNRGPLYKGRILSTEAIQAIQALKRAQRTNPSEIDSSISSTISRLLKPDLLAAYKELLRQEHCDLALRVFSALRLEYDSPDLNLYADMAATLARNGLTEEIDRLICDLENEGAIQLDGSNSKGLIKLVKALIAAGRAESTARVYRLMKRSGAEVDDYLAIVLSKGLRRFGMKEEADEVQMELHRLSRGILDKQQV